MSDTQASGTVNGQPPAAPPNTEHVTLLKANGFEDAEIAALKPERLAAIAGKFAPAPSEPEQPATNPLEEAQRRLARSVGAAGAREIMATLEPLVRGMETLTAAHASGERARLTALYPELKNEAAWKMIAASGDAASTARTLYGERKPAQRLNVSETSARQVSGQEPKLTPKEKFDLGFQALKNGSAKTVDEALASLE